MGFEQSVAWWCFDREDIDALDLVDTLKASGYSAVELAPADKFQMVADRGLKIAADRLHESIERGINSPEHWDLIKGQAENSLKLAQQWDIPNLIGFSGYVGQEFVPTGDWKAALQQAYDVCHIIDLT